MIIKHIANIKGGQDGAVCNHYLFRFNADGLCYVYDTNQLNEYNAEAAELKEMTSFFLDRVDELKPHSNAVMFGKEYYSPDDEFPLLYTNIYNSYSKADNPMKGVCLVYRLQRNDTTFSTTLVQMIEIGFVEDSHYWRSSGDKEDIRPYGNFVIDTQKGIYFALTMRDGTNTTRYFSFDLPTVTQGVTDGQYNVKRVTLCRDDIREYFDCEYHHFLQGACFHDGKIYSLEGFTDSEDHPPVLRVIDASAKKQTLFVDLRNFGLTIEPEMIDFRDDTCYYSDNYGHLYVMDFVEEGRNI